MSPERTDQASGADTTYYRRRPKLSTMALTLRTAALAGAAALILAAGLAWQMARGADPALGGGSAPAAASPAPRVVKTIIVKRIPAPSAGTGTSSGAPASTSYSAPAAAPAPAPVTSSAS